MNLATYVYERAVRSSGYRQLVWLSIRDRLVSIAHDPDCRMLVHGRTLQIPLSHPLALNLSTYPLYDALPSRLASFVRERQGRVVCIDVGANVGNSIAAFVGASGPAPGDAFLAVEPLAVFRRHLEENWGGCPSVTIAPHACGARSGTFAAEFQQKVGTASLATCEMGNPVRFLTIDDLVQEHPDFQAVNILKVDTDGHDLEVLSGAPGCLARSRPAVLFEGEFGGDRDFVQHCMAVLADMRSMGYELLFLYDNVGYLVGTFELDDLALLRHLLFHRIVGGGHYFDFLVMSARDAQPFTQQERAFFVRRIAQPWLREAADRTWS